MAELIRGIENFHRPQGPLVLTIGNFDGVHLGHQRILSRLRHRARALRARAVALSFEPHPLRVLRPHVPLKLLTPLEEKARLMGLYGVDTLVLARFDEAFARLGPEEFIQRVLVEVFAPQEVVVGSGYAFGRGRRGSTELLRRRGRRWGFRLHVVRAVRLGGQVVSSSRVRSVLEAGRVAEALRLLARPYMVEGPVVRGTGRGGRLLGIPTANVQSTYELLPKRGVYAVKVMAAGRLYEAVANLGENPTFGGQGLSLEVHLLRYHGGGLLGQSLRVFFYERLRAEHRFGDPQALKEAILRDIARAEEFFRQKGRRLPGPL